jgi:hypothetical protein
MYETFAVAAAMASAWRARAIRSLVKASSASAARVVMTPPRHHLGWKFAMHPSGSVAQVRSRFAISKMSSPRHQPQVGSSSGSPEK